MNGLQTRVGLGLGLKGRQASSPIGCLLSIGVQGYWVKNLKSLHERLAAFFNDCLKTGNVPTKGKTVSIMKDEAKGKEVTNSWPITRPSLT